MPSARDLRDRVRFERRAAAQNDLGGTSGDWETLIESRFASLTPVPIGRRAGEEVLAQRLQGVGLFDLWVRSDSQTRTVTTDDRVVDARDATRVFAIRWAQDARGLGGVKRGREWILMQLEQGTADG